MSVSLSAELAKARATRGPLKGPCWADLDEEEPVAPTPVSTPRVARPAVPADRFVSPDLLCSRPGFPTPNFNEISRALFSIFQ